ncbi:MAG: ATP12 family chaperone protein, partial [Sphingobium sp.]
MKRFYKEVETVPGESGHGIALDGRPVRTPARALLAVPGAALAEAIAEEWRAQGEDINPGSMPMTGLANAAIDRIAPDPEPFAHGIAAYGESDLTCYRAEGPVELVARQEASWQPLLDWAGGRHGVTFAVTGGIVHVAQPDDTLAALRAAVAAHDPFTLAALSTLVTLSGSLVIGLAAIERAFPIQQLWQAAELDELWQAEQWGDDDEALARRAKRHDEFATASRFAELA